MKQTHQLDRFVINIDELLVQRNLLNLERDAIEAELARDVASTQLHIHGNQLHGAHAATLNRLK